MTQSIAKADVPDLDQWEEMEIVEDIGTPEEHADTFYRWDNFGIEVHDDGSCQAYVIVQSEADGDVPVMVAEGFGSPEEVIEFFRAQEGKEVVENGGEAEGEEEPEEFEDEGGEETSPVPSAAPGDEPNGELAENKPKTDSKPKSKDKKGDEDTDNKKDDKEIKKSDKIASAGTPQEALSNGPGGSASANVDNIEMADGIESHMGTSNTGRKDNVASAKPITVSSRNNSGSTNNIGPVVKSIRDMLAEKEAGKERGMPYGGVTSRTRATIMKSGNAYGYRIKLGQGKTAVGSMANYPTANAQTSMEGMTHKPMRGGSVSKGMPSFAEMMASRGRFVKGDDPFGEEGSGEELEAPPVPEGSAGMPDFPPGEDLEGDGAVLDGEETINDEAPVGEVVDDDVVSALIPLGPETIEKLAAMDQETLSATFNEALAQASEGGAAEGGSTEVPDDLGEETSEGESGEADFGMDGEGEEENTSSDDIY